MYSGKFVQFCCRPTHELLRPWRASGGNWNFPVTFAYLCYDSINQRSVTTFVTTWRRSSTYIGTDIASKLIAPSCTIFELFVVTLQYRLEVTQGHEKWRAPIGRLHRSSCWRSIVMALSSIISEIKQDVGRKSLLCIYLLLYTTSLWKMAANIFAIFYNRTRFLEYQVKSRHVPCRCCKQIVVNVFCLLTT